ncbi:NEDD4-binding protein 2-like 2 [Girardinichthys multiradiatus]|uniref:NEDD4-binding protein 2-like 2 n=1 Tax=Girardinichthys multiradiatus TaxID=208333 RepID=UPI001FACDEF5|nr:NEDD4-binding protein 2-like 2 [Girardinichthys multiradiatus]
MCKMSQPDLFSKSRPRVFEDPCEGGNTKKGGNDSTEKTSGFESNDPVKSLREKVLKEVGLTSTAFIGPAFPPQTQSAKSDIEDTLSIFYKELEKIDTPDGLGENPERGAQPNHSLPELPSSKDSQDVPDGKMFSMAGSAENSYQSNSGPTKSCWPHWHQNEPYYLNRQRPVGNHWDYTLPPNEPVFPRFHRPPFPHQSHQSAYSNPQSTPGHIEVNPNSSGMTNQHQMDFRLPPFSRFPTPNVFIPSSQGFHENPPQHFGWNEQSFYDTDMNNVPGRWSGARREEWQRCDEDYDRPQRFMSENKPWEQQPRYQPYEERCEYQSRLVLILMRGLPGSGKTSRARELLSSGPSGIILSTDDYFAEKEGYHYDPGLLGAAHEWNQSRAKDALQDGRSPIIIDNTNLQAWEMKPYVKMALERGYEVDFCEPDTRWKFDPYELEKRNKHGVPQEKIAQMMDRFSFPISIDIVMSSQEPVHVNQRRQPEHQQIRKKMHFF